MTRTATPSLNGTAHTPEVPAAPLVEVVSSGPRLPRRTGWLDLPAEYGEAGFRIRLWLNPPKAYTMAIFDPAVGVEGTRDVLRQVCLETNGWCDQDGRPYPAPTAEEFWTGPDSIPTELASVIITLISQAPSLLPNSMVSSPAANGQR